MSNDVFLLKNYLYNKTEIIVKLFKILELFKFVQLSKIIVNIELNKFSLK